MPRGTSTTKKSTKSAAASGKTSKGFSAEELAAMKQRAKELKAEERANRDRETGESAVLACIAAMPEPDRSLAKRSHELIKATTPDLWPKTWYGMPAYARHGNVVCFFQDAAKFKARYATLGFSDKANLDEGTLWPVAYALKQLTAADEAMIRSLVKKAVSQSTTSPTPALP